MAVDNDGLTPALCCAATTNVAQCLDLILESLSKTLSQFIAKNDDGKFTVLFFFLSLLLKFA